ncbi:fibronectin-binding protein RevA [Borreliella andersonii]|uniref:fibronectin-binding protein RevA n=1 Tax=Borrelia andersonii TaxID=42109 RepID=UPI003AB113E6
MKNKNLVKLFFISMLFVMACKAYLKEKKQIDLLISGVATLKNDSAGKEFKDYKDKINKLKESLKDVSDGELQEKLLNLESLFQDKLAAKLEAVKAAEQAIDSRTYKDIDIIRVWREAMLVEALID